MKNNNKIKKPFYKRWWFIAFIVAAAMGGVMELLGIDTDGEKVTEPSQEVASKNEKDEPAGKKKEPEVQKNEISKKEKKAQEKQAEEAKAKEEKRIADEEAQKKEEQRILDSDITNLSEKATPEQKITLSTLADMQFKEQYPYKGSKMRSILGVLQDWTSTDGETWFYKVEATIVNAFGAERSANVEVSITPNGPDSGYVSFIDY